MARFPGLVAFDSLSTSAVGGHISTTWFATQAPPEEVLRWYAEQLTGHDRDHPGGWTSREADGHVRRFSSVTVHAVLEHAPGPRPNRAAPDGTRTVVREDTGAMTAPAPGPAPAAQPVRRRSWWSRLFG